MLWKHLISPRAKKFIVCQPSGKLETARLGHKNCCSRLAWNFWTMSFIVLTLARRTYFICASEATLRMSLIPRWRRSLWRIWLILVKFNMEDIPLEMSSTQHFPLSYNQLQQHGRWSNLWGGSDTIITYLGSFCNVLSRIPLTRQVINGFRIWRIDFSNIHQAELKLIVTQSYCNCNTS
jgi:hypothetical protein